MSPWVADLLQQYGYAILAVIVFFQHCAVPAPGQAAYLGASILAGREVLALPIVIAVGFASAFAGYSAAYWIGQRGGRRLVEKHGRWVALTPARLVQLERFCAKHGGKTLLLARFVVGIRAVGGLFGGISGVDRRHFVVMNLIGSLAWAGVFGSVGYLFGESWERFEGLFGTIGLVVAGTITLGIVTLVLIQRRRARVEKLDD